MNVKILLFLLMNLSFFGYVGYIIKKYGVDSTFKIHPDTAHKAILGMLKYFKDNDIDKEEIDLIVVPGLLFSSRGFRIGFGGGFYDRYLADYQGETCSLVFSEQLYDDWEVEDFDIPVQKIYTDSYKGGAVNE